MNVKAMNAANKKTKVTTLQQGKTLNKEKEEKKGAGNDDDGDSRAGRGGGGSS